MEGYADPVKDEPSTQGAQHSYNCLLKAFSTIISTEQEVFPSPTPNYLPCHLGPCMAVLSTLPQAKVRVSCSTGALMPLPPCEVYPILP
eukprot:1160787-Pelagomonas_calceolata.AAC.11